MSEERVKEILAAVKPLAVEFYRLTKKPLGVTGEIAEYVAAEKLGLKLVEARMQGYDALRGDERIQIKGRAFSKTAKKSQRISRIKLDAPCDTVLSCFSTMKRSIRPKCGKHRTNPSANVCPVRDRRQGRGVHLAYRHSRRSRTLAAYGHQTPD